MSVDIVAVCEDCATLFVTMASQLKGRRCMRPKEGIDTFCRGRILTPDHPSQEVLLSSFKLGGMEAMMAAFATTTDYRWFIRKAAGSKDAMIASEQACHPDVVCPLCRVKLIPEHAHSRCPKCGYRDSCCF